MRHFHDHPHRVHLPRAGVLAGATALAVLAAAGCDPHRDGIAAGADSPAEPAPTGSSTGSAAPTAPSATTAVPAPSTPAATRLRFPDSTRTVQLVGYDKAVGMVRFRLVVGERTDDGTGHLSVRYFEPDPADPATHRLPLASGATIRSAFHELCGASPGCTPAVQLVRMLHTDRQPCAIVHVNAADRIDTVTEDFRGMGGDAPPPQPG